MYAIAFDLEQDILSKTYGNSSYQNAHLDIQKALQECGFVRQQGSVYFGNESVDSVRCVLAVQKLSSKFKWFSSSVKDIRMLRIEENNDLSLAIK